MARVVVVGSINVDLTFRVARLPRPGETVAASTLSSGHGGKGANQAVMAARLGAVVTLLAAVGDDAFGRQALDHLRGQGVDVGRVGVRSDQPTGTAGILVDDQAANVIVVAGGANATVTAADVRAASEVIRSADAVLTQLETPIAAAVEAFRLARAAGVRTILNPAPAAPLSDELLALTDLCVPNEAELSALTDTAGEGLQEIEATARRLRRRGPGAVLVTLGERGALLLSADHTGHIPAVPVRAVDPTAAGDAFIGSLAVYLAGGAALADAARRACAVAALTVTRPGAQESFPSRQEAEAFAAATPSLQPRPQDAGP